MTASTSSWKKKQQPRLCKMRLLVITRPDFFEKEARQITELFDNGLQTLHLRKPQATVESIRQLIEAIPERYHSRIVTHDSFQLASEYSLKGIHLNGRNPAAPSGYTGSISRSCHSLEEVEHYKHSCDYVFLSPIYDSISKTGYRTGFSLQNLQDAAARNIIDEKVIGLGGMEASHLPQLRTLGFGGAAFLGDIWRYNDTNDFIAHFLKLQSICNNLK